MTSLNTPIIILGAGRSGTNMLRDHLCQLNGIGTWPCDEINYIWRYGNARFPFDTLTPDHASTRTTRYIRNAFANIGRERNLDRVVEKTCANTVRVPFVDKIVPEAKYVHIVRDGRDVAASAVLRWTASLDIPYLVKKARYVPVGDLPYYALKYLGNRISRMRSKDKKLSFWGPRFEELEHFMRTYSLPVSCAMQWNFCVEQTEQALAAMQTGRAITMRYEDYLADPVARMAEVVDHLGIDAADADIERVTSGVRSGNTGKWQEQLSAEDTSKIQELVGGTLSKHGYC